MEDVKTFGQNHKKITQYFPLKPKHQQPTKTKHYKEHLQVFSDYITSSNLFEVKDILIFPVILCDRAGFLGTGNWVLD